MLRSKRLFFSIILMSSLIMELCALYFQYVLDYGPCILCVQIRAVVLVVGVLSLLGLLFHEKVIVIKLISGCLSFFSGCFVFLCYRVLGIERGWFEGSCTFSNPFPDWMPLHEWIPTVFEAWELCGYTPEIALGITMAEVLMTISVVFVLLSVLVSLKK